MIEERHGRASLIDRVGGSFLSRTLRVVPAVALAAILSGVPLGQPIAEAAARTTTSPDGALPAGLPQNTYFDVVQGRGYRFNRGGWIYVHLEGSPHDIGYQHGYLLATEIADAFQVVRLEDTHESGRDWEFFRRAAREMLWSKIDPEYQSEMFGIVDGLQARGGKLDIWDIVALNAFSELADYYVPWLDKQTSTRMGRANRSRRRESAKLEDFDHCSAFVATGSWTKDHQIVMAHNNWTTYMEGARWNIIFDISPERGYRMLMDGFPGVITSDDDFVVNSAGLMITETTIANFSGWDPNGKPEFMRSRKAAQYGDSIDNYAKIMIDGNNGGYANDWLIGDRKTGEIARLELGLKHTKLWRTMDGYYSGANFPSDPDVIKDETTYDPNDPASSMNARKLRWDELLSGNKGKIDTDLAEVFLADHYDTFTKKEGANRRTLCGHGDMQAETLPGSTSPPFDPHGAVQAKVVDSRLAEKMDFIARIGHPCGTNFDAAKFLAAHPEFSWQAPVLRDMIAGPWTDFRIGEHAAQQGQ
jgi:Phospholipase B